MRARTAANPVAEILVRSNAVMTRVLMVNSTLHSLRINCAELDALASAGSCQLAVVDTMNRAGDRAGIGTSLSEFRQTVTRLRDAYRVILIREDLPGETAHGVLSVAQSLDVTAVKAGLV
jgi:hypothetical protein